jgi:hypothetical protein
MKMSHNVASQTGCHGAGACMIQKETMDMAIYCLLTRLVRRNSLLPDVLQDQKTLLIGAHQT